MNLDKFKNWLLDKGCEILPPTNDFEAIRFKGSQTGVLYTSGRVSNPYTRGAIEAYQTRSKWDGGPIKVGRHAGYSKQKKALLKRDGDKCFFCGLPMDDDITVEHLISLANGGLNTLSNMVLAHEKCNQDAGTLPIYQKVQLAIKNRTK